MHAGFKALLKSTYPKNSPHNQRPSSYRARPFVFLFYALANLGDGWYTGVNVLAAALGADCLSIQ